MARLSGLQREILSLYRKCLRETRKKPANHDKKDYSAIEYMLRRGQRQLETYASPGIRNIK
ncbi:hypothetical protein E4T44_14946 [Aureobasidium sp. EXF-8845]|nr:hypothetical protein E4T44_14946 [Aureobasidium sp. EXF-8845]